MYLTKAYKPLTKTSAIDHNCFVFGCGVLIIGAHHRVNLPDPVINTTLDLSDAFANFLMNASFSNITFENSSVLKYGTCSAPIAHTISVKLNRSYCEIKHLLTLQINSRPTLVLKTPGILYGLLLFFHAGL